MWKCVLVSKARLDLKSSKSILEFRSMCILIKNIHTKAASIPLKITDSDNILTFYMKLKLKATEIMWILSVEFLSIIKRLKLKYYCWTRNVNCHTGMEELIIQSKSTENRPYNVFMDIPSLHIIYMKYLLGKSSEFSMKYVQFYYEKPQDNIMCYHDH